MEFLNESIKVAKAIKSIKPNSEFIAGETYASIIWDSQDQVKPTEQEFNDAVTAYKEQYDANQYQRDRASSSGYPSIPDQLDEIYHNGINSWKAVIKVTKDKYPKG